MTMEDVPRKEACYERAGHPEQDRASDPHRVGTGVQQTRKRTHDESDDGEKDEEQNQ
jgi:hypothetical protein